jgi:hypothetical protein
VIASNLRSSLLWVLALILAISSQAAAQYRPTYLPGLIGLDAGSQAPPGIYLANINYIYPTDVIKNDNGDNINRPGISVTAFMEAVAFAYVTNVKIFGGNLGGQVLIPWMRNRIELNSLDAKPGLGYSDTLWQPLQIGWHKERADFVVGYLIAFPTGRQFPASGLDQIEHVLQAGTTVHLDKAKSWAAAAMFSVSFDQTKQHKDITVGRTGTVEWGVGKTFMHKVNNPIPVVWKLGVIGYGQFKITGDSGSGIPPVLRGFKDRVFAIGPEFNILLPWTGTIIDVRYSKEFGARVRTEGQAISISITQVLKQLTPKPPAKP